MHYPFAEGAIPPTTNPDYYKPLQEICLPQGARVVAGFIHEALSFEENVGILPAIETAREQPVDVPCSCRLDRRTPEQVNQLLELTRQVILA